MLVLSRNSGEYFTIKVVDASKIQNGETILIKLVRVDSGNRARIGIEAKDCFNVGRPDAKKGQR